MVDHSEAERHDSTTDPASYSREFFESALDPDGRNGNSTGAHSAHSALLYDTPEGQFAAIVPRIKDALERGDRCLYVYDDNTAADVRTALRAAGIDVDARRAAGALSLHSASEIYLRNGEFDPEEMTEFLAETIREGCEEYNGVLIAGETTWMLDGDHSLESWLRYEYMVRDVDVEPNGTLVCQYDVTEFPAEFLNYVVRSHSDLVMGGSVDEDVYYIPSEELDVEDGTRADVERSPRTLVEQVNVHDRLKRRERGLSALSDATEELMHLDAGIIEDRIAGIVRSVLGVEFASFRPYDGQTGKLEAHDASTDLVENLPAFADRYDDLAWETFATGETSVRNDLPSDGGDGSGPSYGSGIIVSLGRHGVFCAASPRSGAFDETTVELAETVGTDIETALDRAERERTLEEKNDQLERLNRINSVIRRISEALVEADTRAEIERTVCERLVASDPYRFVWIGGPDVEAGTIAARAWAGDSPDFLKDNALTTADAPVDQEPVADAIRTRTVRSVQDVLIDPDCKPWREEALAHGFRACISVPLIYEESFYGVVTLYAGEPNVFNETEREVLAELGGMIAHAIDADETRRTLRTDAVIELSLEIRGADGALDRLATEVGCTIDFDGLVPRTDDATHLFFRVESEFAEGIEAVGDRLPAVDEIRRLREVEYGTERLFEAVVTEPTLPSRIADRQATIHSLTVTEESTTTTVNLPVTADVREFVETLRATYPDVELLTRHTRDRPIKTQQDLRTAGLERLTDRQRAVLQTAYLSGFFESPRARTGEETAEALDVSQPTFTYHLREAQRTLCELLFDKK